MSEGLMMNPDYVEDFIEEHSTTGYSKPLHVMFDEEHKWSQAPKRYSITPAIYETTYTPRTARDKAKSKAQKLARKKNRKNEVLR